MEGKNILVIDDDNNNTQQISEILRKEGYTVYSASTKIEALETALKVHPALALVKSMLIDSSGYEVIRDLRNEESLKNTPFIMLSDIEKKYDDRYRTIYKIVDTIKIPVEKSDLLLKVKVHLSPPAPGAEEDIHVEPTPQPDDTYELDDDKHAELKFDLAEQPVSDNLRHADSITLDDKTGHDYPSYESTLKIDTEEIRAITDEHSTEPDKYTSADYIETDSHYTDSKDQTPHRDVEYVVEGEDITTIEPDEEEILRSLKESRDKRKKLFTAAAAGVFVVILAVVYMFFIHDTKPGPTTPTTMAAAKGALNKETPPSTPSTPQPPPKTPEPTVSPTPTPAPAKTPPAAQTPVAPTPAPVAIQKTPAPKPETTPAGL